ncbi:Heparinase II/III-like protein [Paramagnetospirillum magnetotacticum MS-1]|uniref:Heparinase II/III-like protein n=1 Tax=Paramagnetospirillum magnetotacticum MS-1 TaxID=272627 RepID=A0A0C2YDN7_PARME|nr:heparinase II/III family protein [Paramagnetospirillum magnetotacticum]KIL97824.1 Heparinase II/III-like protein [Paramagnetospirillum magnetotacticum MS-1]
MRLWRTLQYLRLSQVAYRLWYRARLPWFCTSLASARLGDGSGAPIWAPPPPKTGDSGNGGLILSGRIRLVGIEGPAEGWADASMPLLWRFTLHYFEWLADLEALGGEGREPARTLVARWLARFERFDPVAWHPYPLSLRLVSWLAHARFLCEGASPDFVSAFHRSLHRQARHLNRVWERDVGGNHLIKNLKAAIACALCLPGHETGLDRALTELDRQLNRQILSDGCHYERSPSYHFQVLSDLEELCVLFSEAGKVVPGFLSDAVERMRPAAAFFLMAPGKLAQFNDGTVDGPERVEAVAPPALPRAGYWRLEAGSARLMVDCGPCCPDDLPAHAHADTLSFELYDGGVPLIANCGTYAYQDLDWRNRFRGTAFHSTLTVDDQDSAEVYGAFRLGRRPRHFAASVEKGRFRGEFDGWTRFGLIHRRSLELGASGLAGRDEVARAAPGPRHGLAIRFHLHPSVTAVAEGEGVRLSLPGRAVWRFKAQGLTVSLDDSVYSPRFHEMCPTRCLKVEAPLSGERMTLDWRFERIT